MTLSLLAPAPTELLARARADLRMGVPVVFVGEGGAGAVVASAETLDAARLSWFAAAQGAGLALTARRASVLKLPVYDGDLTRISLPQGITCARLRALADPVGDLAHPFKGPFKPIREGDARLARAGICLSKEAQILPAVIFAPLEAPLVFAAEQGLTLLPAATVLAQEGAQYQGVVSARVPMEAFAKGRLHIFRPGDGTEEHYAVEFGSPDRSAPVLARLHSACFTGDVLGSLKCDCGPQLHGAMAQMGEEGAGVLLYLNQEGRGIGLANKMRAYALQDQGFDTVEANHRLGFEDDERDFRIGAKLLKEMGFSQVRLLTNNPRKMALMEEAGIKVVERVPLKVGENPFNEAYLATKAAKSGHLL